MAVILAVLAVMGLAAVLIVWQAWAVSLLWGWFLVPLGAPELHVPMAVGIVALVSLLWGTYRKTERGSEAWKRIGFHVLNPAICVAIGWLALQAM